MNNFSTLPASKCDTTLQQGKLLTTRIAMHQLIQIRLMFQPSARIGHYTAIFKLEAWRNQSEQLS